MNNQKPTQKQDTIMEEFTFIEWVEYTVWQSEHFTVYAETYEEAKEKFLNEFDNGDDSQYSDGNLDFHLEDVVDTGNYELYDNDGKLLRKGNK